MAASKSHEVAHPAQAHEKVQPHQTASAQASERLLQDAQLFSGVLNRDSAPYPNGPFSQTTRATTMAETMNTKLNQVNEMSPADRNTWIADVNKAGKDQNLQMSFDNLARPIGIDVQTGADGKANSFQLSIQNYDEPGYTSRAATLDGNVGSNGVQNLHFDAGKTDPQFAMNESVGMSHIAEGGIKTADMSEYAAEVQAMPAALRQQMIADTKKILPTVKMNTDSQGNLLSVDFPGGHLTPQDWTTANQARATEMTAEDSRDLHDTVQRYDAPRPTASQQAYSGGDDYYSAPAASRGSSSSGSDRQSAPRSGTVVEGVGANPGTYIMNSDGTASRWGN